MKGRETGLSLFRAPGPSSVAQPHPATQALPRDIFESGGGMLEKLFGLDAHGTTVRRELVAGATTFLTMAYIMFVNPKILAAAGLDLGAVFVATCLAAALRHGADGPLCQPAGGAGARHGHERLFRLHGRACPGRELAARARLRLPLGHSVRRAVGLACARMADQCAAEEPQAFDRRRHRLLPGADRLRQCRHRHREPGHAHPGRRSSRARRF